MIALWQYVLRNLGRRRLRTVLGALGIFLTIALLMAARIGLDSISASYTDLVALQAGKADLIITAAEGQLWQPRSFSPVEVEKKLASNPHLRGLSPRLIGFVRIRSADREDDAFLIGLNPERERELNLSSLTPDPALGEGTCAISKALAARLKTERGADLTVRSVMDSGGRQLRLTTIIERQLLLPQEVRDFIVVSEPVARELLGEPDAVHFLAGAFRQAASYYDARDLHTSVLQLKQAGAAIAADLGAAYDVRLPKATAITAFEHFSSPVKAVFGVFAVLGLAVAGLLIYSLISVGVEERVREYAILRTLGAKRRDVFSLVLTESVLLCFSGVVPGALAGVVVARGIVKVVEWIWRAEGDAVMLTVSSSTLWLTLGTGLALSIGSALIPAFQAVRWRIVDALDPLRRGQIRPEPPQEAAAHRPFLVTGLALSALSVVVFYVLPTAFLSGDPSLIGAVVLCLLLAILLGFSLIAVAVLPGITQVVLFTIGWAFGPSAELAGRNLLRYRRRNTTTALMFILAVSLVIFVASLVALFSHISANMVEHVNGAAIRVQSGAIRAVSLKDDLARLEGVTGVSEVRSLRSRTESGVANDVVISDLVGMKNLWIVPFGVDADLASVLFTSRIQYDQGGPDALEQLMTYQAQGNSNPKAAGAVAPLILSLSAARFLNVQAGDLVQLSFHLGSARSDARFRIVAVCGAMPGFENFRSRVARAVGAGVLIPASVFKRLTAAAREEAIQVGYFIKTEASEAVQKTVARKIREESDLRYRFGVRSTVEQQEQARILYWATQIFFGLLLAVAVVISVFALVASMASAVIERRWEIGVLKALGLRRGHLLRMFLGEAVVLTLSAGFAGGIIGFVLAYLFVLEAAVLMEIPVVFTMPYLTFLATFVISLIAGAVAAHLPTRQLLRKPAAEIMRLQV